MKLAPSKSTASRSRPNNRKAGSHLPALTPASRSGSGSSPASTAGGGWHGLNPSFASPTSRPAPPSRSSHHEHRRRLAMSDGNGILLKGLDGSNPLAFLAALGTLRTLTIALPGESVKMNWEQHEGAWRPRVRCSLASDRDAIIEKLDKGLTRLRSLHPLRFIDYRS